MKNVLIEFELDDDFDLSSLQGYEFPDIGGNASWRFVEPAQEPVALRFPTMLRKMWSGGEVQQWLDEQGPLYAHPEREGWRQIETAPKDDPYGFLVGRSADAGVEGVQQVIAIGGKFINLAVGEFKNPTHWMPLPAAPTGKGGD